MNRSRSVLWMTDPQVWWLWRCDPTRQVTRRLRPVESAAVSNSTTVDDLLARVQAFEDDFARFVTEMEAGLDSPLSRADCNRVGGVLLQRVVPAFTAKMQSLITSYGFS